MIFGKKPQPGEDTSLRYLAQILGSKDLKPELDPSLKQQTREHLLATILRGQKADYLNKTDQKVVSNLQKVSHEVVLSNYQRIVLKERIFAYVKKHQKKFSVAGWVNSYKLSLSALVLVAFVFTTILSLPSATYVTKASKATLIEEVKGEVYILRDGQTLEAKTEVSLKEGDILITKANSFITVRFFDDSVSRLGQNTAIEIKKLYSEPLNSTKTAIEVGLQEGYVWAKVVNLNEESSFIINTDNAVATVKNKAAFEMEKNDKVTTVMVFDNVVDFKTKSTSIDNSQPVVAGFTAQIASEISFHSTDQVSDHTFVVSESQKVADDWVSLNMDLDRAYEEKIKKENQDFIDKAANNENTSLGFLQNVQDGTQAIFDDEFAKNRKTIEEAQFAFIKGQKLLLESNHKNQKRTEALQYLYQYRTTIRGFMERIPQLKEQNADQAEILLNEVKDFVSSHRKNLALVLPGEKLFTAKEIIDDVASYAVQDKLEKLEYLLADAKTTLLEVQGLMNKEQISEAEARFNVYFKKVDELVIALNAGDSSDFNAKVIELFNQQIEQIKLLTSIEKKLEKQSMPKMRDVVIKVRQASIEQLLVVYKDLEAGFLPFEFFQELRSLVVNYFAEGESKLKVLLELEELMKKYSEYNLFKEAQFTTIVQPSTATEAQTSEDQMSGDSIKLEEALPSTSEQPSAEPTSSEQSSSEQRADPEQTDAPGVITSEVSTDVNSTEHLPGSDFLSDERS